MRAFAFLFTMLFISCFDTESIAAPSTEFYELKIYQIDTPEQEKVVEEYLQQAYLPALHRYGIAKVGVFKPIEQDTTYFGKRIYVLVPFQSLEKFAALPEALLKDKKYLEAGKKYIDAPYNAPPYARIESIILKAFKDMPRMEVPAHSTPVSERIYELRSYEGPTEKIYKNKEHMFNEGGEVPLFKRLGFNAVFYAEVIAGGRRPNLMYMTTFTDMASHDAHWKSFVNDPEWIKLKAMPEYQNNVSNINIYLLHPTTYSDI